MTTTDDQTADALNQIAASLSELLVEMRKQTEHSAQIRQALSAMAKSLAVVAGKSR